MGGIRMRAALLAGMAVLAVALMGCSGSDSDSGSAGMTTRAGTPTGAAAGAEEAPGGAVPSPQADHGSVIGLDLQVPELGVRIVKNASISLRVKDGTYDDRIQRVVQLAGAHSGFVASSRTSGTTHPSGTLVLRVPVQQFEAVLGALKDLGTVKSQEITGDDVTAQFVDLEARLRNWEAQEGVLLGLMAKAGTIQESITVQKNLQDVQLAIEQITGQLRVLEDQTAMSTITLTLSEPGTPVAEPDEGLPSIPEAWSLALDGFVAVVATVMISVGYVLPIAVMAAVAWLVVRRVRVRQRSRMTPPLVPESG